MGENKESKKADSSRGSLRDHASTERNGQGIQGDLFGDSLQELGPDVEKRIMEAREAIREVEQAKSVEELSNILRRHGAYFPLGKSSIYERGKGYCKNHVNSISAKLIEFGVSEETTTQVVHDYISIAVGNYNVEAEPKRMAEALRTIKPYAAYLLDKYGLYFHLLRYYSKIIQALNKIIEIKRDWTVEAKERYIDGYMSGAESNQTIEERRAVGWLLQNKYITLADFAGVEPSKISYFADKVFVECEVMDYMKFYHFAKYALLAMPEELDSIMKPSGDKFDENCDMAGLAELYSSAAEKDLTDAAEKLANMAGSEKPATQQLSSVLSTIQSRAPYVSPHGKEVDGILPIQPYIERFLEENHINVSVSPYRVQQALDGVNLMSKDKIVSPVNGYYTYQTNFSEFSKYCGLTDAGQQENLELFNALRVIDFAAWLVLWKPRGGLTAVRVLTITEITEKGNFTINVTEEALKGRPKLVTASGYDKLRKEAKGKAKRQFLNQLLTKSHKEEKALVEEVFDYQEGLDMSGRTGGEQAEREFKEYWRKHRSSFVKKIRNWFEEYAQNNAFKYRIETTPRGETVYYWEKGELLNPPREQDDSHGTEADQ